MTKLKLFSCLCALSLLLAGCPNSQPSSSGHAPGDGHDHAAEKSGEHKTGDGHDHSAEKSGEHKAGDGHDH